MSHKVTEYNTNFGDIPVNPLIATRDTNEGYWITPSKITIAHVNISPTSRRINVQSSLLLFIYTFIVLCTVRLSS